MTTSGPLISIITPTYNQGGYIKDCIDSVRQQTYKNVEHLIFDACSSDETRSVVSNYLGTYNLIFVSESDKGQSDAINKGLNNAKGEIVCWLNSDDFFFDSHVLEKVVSIFQANPLFQVITGDGYYVDSSRGLMAPILLQAKYLTLAHFRTADYLLQPSTFWKRNPVRMDVTLHYTFDWKFFTELFSRGYRYYYAREYFACYRVHDSSKTHIDSARRKAEVMHLLKEHGVSAICIAWAWIVVLLYRLSEKTGLKVIKSIARIVTNFLHRLTNGRITSG